ncbi:hypothetical protein LOCC1_G006893 [Lachnellula occidentalis]|uniref:Proteasome subunit beta type protein n=1 Tax=Lachnellula occidentalis TaxID=215460 RepID=A0A8H8RGM1_9HELO|nr:hypothetical protein LOCC1_G006893 [Lachnellula occidentalis]
MAATAPSGYPLRNSGIRSSDVPQRTRDRLMSSTYQTIPPSDSTTTSNQTLPPSTSADSSDQTFTPSASTTSSDASSSYQSTINNATTDAEKPDFIATQTVKVNRMVNDFNHLKQELTKTPITDSHELAREDHDFKGEVQRQPLLDGKVKDLGWHKKLNEMPDPLIGGLSNPALFARIRRFNKDVFDVQALRLAKTNDLDLTEAWDNDHKTDKLTLHLQRAYLSIVLPLASLGKQLSRLRSWKETRRTAAFCIIYFAAWFFNLLMPLVLGTLVVIIGSRDARNIIFPPVPLPLVNSGTGGLQKPQSGQLGTTDTLTGAPEKAEGEAREEEAANFVENVRHLVQRAVGMHDNNESEGDPLEGKVPKPIRNAIKSVKDAGATQGHVTETPGENMTQKPMEDLLWDKSKPNVIKTVAKVAPHVLGEIVDDWERFANAISPTPPFPRLSFLKIEAVFVPLFLISLLVPQYMVYKGTGFAVGFVLFGDPIISPGLRLLDREFPTWKEVFNPKNNIFRGLPTNNQLTLTLLRIGEAHNSPIPPVPGTKPTDANRLPDVKVDDIPLNATRQEVADAMYPSDMPIGHVDHSSPTTAKADQDSGEGEKEKPKHRHLSKVLGLMKWSNKATVETKLKIDQVRATAGSHEARGHIGVLPKEKYLIYAGPAEFVARYDGKRGWLCITSPIPSASTSSTTSPRLIFTVTDPRGKHDQLDLFDKSNTLWSINIADIHRLKRASAFAAKTAEKAAQSQDKDLLASLEIEDKMGKVWRFTAIPERDELFNRLVAVGPQRWENM